MNNGKSKGKNVKDIYSLSPMQEGMLFHWLKNPGSSAYFEQVELAIAGDPDPNLVEKSFNALIQRYDILRTVFIYENIKEPVQVVLKEKNTRLYYQDLSAAPEESGAALQTFKKQDRQAGFDLSKEILIRLALFKVTANQFRLIWSFHHILMDGWCLGILFKDFIRLYRHFQSGVPHGLEPVIPYSHYIRWLEKKDRDKGLEYWREYLAGYEERILAPGSEGAFSAEHNRNEYKLATYQLHFEDDLCDGIRKIASEHMATVNVIFQVTWGIVLQRHNYNDDVVFGTVVSGRTPEIEDIENMVGLFINTIPVRITGRADDTFPELVRNVGEKESASKMYEHVPLVEILTASHLKGNLVDHLMVFESIGGSFAGYENRANETTGPFNETESLHVQGMEVHEQTNYHFNILVNTGKRMALEFNYNENIFPKDVILRTAAQWLRVLRQVTEQPGIPISRLDIIPEEDKRRILEEFNHTADHGEGDLPAVFEERFAKRAGHIAVDASRAVTFEHMDRLTEALALKLRRQGVGPSSLAAVLVERSLEMVVAIVAILRAGGAYLPIDPSYPHERIDYILKDSQCKWLLTTAGLETGIDTNAEIIYIEETPEETGPLELVNRPDDPAYVIYTSGSTGRPKGTLVEHRSVINVLTGHQRLYPLEEGDTFLLKTNYTFDVSVTELLGWFFGKGKLAVLPEGKEKDPMEMIDCIYQRGVTHINFVPSMLNVFLDTISRDSEAIKKLAGLKYILVAGEAFTPALARKINALNLPASVENIFGPTEGTVYSSYYSLSGWDDGRRVPIGVPFDNVVLYILDPYRNLQPIGAAGELCIGGAGVARGYINNPELTADRFVLDRHTIHHPPSTIHRLYRTGDRARQLPDGKIEFLGRIDHQVKVRGFRVELGEIENKLAKHASVKETVVTLIEEEDDKYLCAYYVPAEPGEAGENPLKAYLAEELPYYMIPSHFVQLDRIPLTPSGKVNRAALDKPGVRMTGVYKAPRNILEERLAGLWSLVLGIEKEHIGIDSHFFNIGGHSIKAIQLASMIHKEFQVRVSVNKLFDIPTIRGIAAYIRRLAPLVYNPVEPAEQREYYPLTPGQRRIFFVQQIDEHNYGYNMPHVVALQGGLDRSNVEKTFNTIIQRHQSLRTSFRIVDTYPVQIIHDRPEFQLNYYETEDPEPLVKDFVKPFDLKKAPLFRAGLIKVAEHRHVLMVDLHHIVSDALSIQVLVREFIALYRERELPPLAVQFKDFAQWQQQAVNREELQRQEQYWLAHFSGRLPILDLPSDFPRPAVQTFEGDTIHFVLDRELLEPLRLLAAGMNVTFYMLFLSVYAILMMKLTGDEDIIIGTGLSYRNDLELHALIGLFVNTLALRLSPRKDKTFSTLLQEVRQNVLQAFENQDYPFEDLVDKLKIERDVSRNPLFNVGFDYQTVHLETETAAKPRSGAAGLSMKPYPYIKPTTKMDISLYVVEKGPSVSFSMEYSTRLFKRETMERFVQYYNDIIRAVLQKDNIRLNDIKVAHQLYTRELVIPEENIGGFNF
jgi:amino acid adenylation domain-containing protein